MKKITRNRRDENLMQSANFVAILALVTEMARQLNANLAKVRLEPLNEVLVAPGGRHQTEPNA